MSRSQTRSHGRPPTRTPATVRPFRPLSYSFFNPTSLPSTSTSSLETFSASTSNMVEQQPVLLWPPPVVENVLSTVPKRGVKSVPLSSPTLVSSLRRDLPRSASVHPKAKNNTFSCRLCDRSFHDVCDVINIHSDQGQKLQIATKMLYTLSIMTTKKDPTSNFVCKVCCGHLECNFKFAWSCRARNYDIINSIILKSNHDHTFLEELKKCLKTPAQSLYFKPSVNLNEPYESLANYMNNPEATSKIFNRHLDIRVLNELEKKKPLVKTNGLKQIPSVQSSTSVTNGLNKGSRNTNLIPRITILNRNKIVPNGPTVLNNTHIDHNYNGTESRVNGTAAIDNNEIICLDDDEDDHNNNDPQVVKTNEIPTCSWVLNDKNSSKKISKFQGNKALQKRFQINRKLISFNSQSENQNTSFESTSRHSNVTNVASEDVTVTPDMPLLNTYAVSPLNQPENNYYEGPSPIANIPNVSPLVTPETGIHFLFEAEETVDLTTESPKRKPGPSRGKRKIKTSDMKKSPPLKKICRKTFVLENVVEENNQLPPKSLPEPDVQPRTIAVKKSIVSKPKPKRFSKRLLYKPLLKSKPKQVLNINTTNDLNQYSNLLGRHTSGNWETRLSRIDFDDYKCPICEVYFCSIRMRQDHELSHFLPSEFPPPQVIPDEEFENPTNPEQQEFLLRLNLVKKRPLKQKIMDLLANRPNVLKAIQTVGNTLGTYSCHFCKYNTCRLFILWAHLTSCHNKPVTEKKSNTFCFLCNRTLNKHTKLLKHVDQCIKNQLKNEKTVDTSSVRHFACDICNYTVNSLSDLEKHVWHHMDISHKRNN